MANFKSWKRYMLFLIDRFVEEHKLESPFLDAGCGAGDVALHFAARGWNGFAVDFSEDAVQLVEPRFNRTRSVRLMHADLMHIEVPPVKTIFLLDVIEHVKHDSELLLKMGELLSPGGYLVATVPVDPREWRWDDAFYGHYRRYTREDLHALFKRNGYEVVCDWDCSFPLFWLMRRVYTRLIRKEEFEHLSPEERTKVSTCQSAWDYSILSSLIDSLFLKIGLGYFHYPFRKLPWGCESLLLARKIEMPSSDLATIHSNDFATAGH